MIDSQKDTGDGNKNRIPIVIYICVFMVILEKNAFTNLVWWNVNCNLRAC